MHPFSIAGFRLAGLCAALLLLLFGSPLRAADAGHVAQAERFLKQADAHRMTVPVYIQVQQMFAERFAQSQSPESQRALLERYQSKADAVLDREIGWDKLRPELVGLYTEAFSEQELVQLNEFYASELGRKVLALLPQLNARSAQLTQARLQAAVPEVNRLLEEMSSELQTLKP